MSASFPVDMSNAGFAAIFDFNAPNTAASGAGGAAPVNTSVVANPKNRPGPKDIGTADPLVIAHDVFFDTREQNIKDTIRVKRAIGLLKPQIAAVVVGSPDAAPTKGQVNPPLANAGSAAAAAAAPTTAAAVDQLAKSSANFNTADDINRLIAGMAGLDFS